MSTPTSPPLIQRPHYFSGEALLTQDFVCEQQYHMTIQSLNNRSLYTYGIATGLEVAWNPDANVNQVEVRTGMAIDSLGRQIILVEPEVVSLVDVVNGASYFLTIRYHQVYSDYTDETGVPGYKRIVETPQIRYARNLPEPGLDILLAVIIFSSQGDINEVTYRSGTAARRYVSSTLGALTLITEGAGIDGGRANPTLTNLTLANETTLYPSLSAKQEVLSKTVYLEVDATHSKFTGDVTTHGNLGIGNDQPVANLQVDSLEFPGEGLLSSSGALVTISKPVTPFFEVGDILIADPPVTAMTGGIVKYGNTQPRKIVAVDRAKRQVTVDKSFDPPLAGIRYTYKRSTLARFSVSTDNSVFSITLDGTVGLGVQASTQSGTGTSGRHALVVTPDSRVGIGLVDRDPNPSSTLDVNGQINSLALEVNGQVRALSLIASGTIQAQSFVGNGSNLTNLPVLSYWTRAQVGTPTSNLYYDDGNVGIRDKQPLGSLSVGSGKAFIGKGVITSLSETVVEGYQTAFQDQVNAGDSITVGTLTEQIGVISQIVDDDTLLLQEQLPISVTNSPYQYQPPNGGAKQPGQGTISTNGTTIVGNKTNFKSTVAMGGKIIIERFDAANSVSQERAIASVQTDTSLTLKTPFAVNVTTPTSYQVKNAKGELQTVSGKITSDGVTVIGSDGTKFLAFKDGDYTLILPPTSTLPQTLLVKSVDSQTKLTLNLPVHKDAQFSAATSAFVVTPSVLAYMAVNPDNGVLPPDTVMPPALVVTTNYRTDKPNTVAINTPLDEIDTRYALQVKGNINATGFSIDVDDLHVKTLEASKSITVESDGTVDTVLAAGLANADPLLTVNKSNVVVGPSSAQYALDVKGVAHASGNLVTDATLQAAAMQVAGTVISSNGSVKMIGQRNAYTRADMTRNGTYFTLTATTDGYVMATVGEPTWTRNYCGSLSGRTYDTSNNTTSFIYATGLSYLYDTRGKKGGGGLYALPVPGSFTMPVRSGERWELTLTWNQSLGDAPAVEFYWVPLGLPPGAMALAAEAAPAMPPGGGMAALLDQLRDDLDSGRLDASMQESARSAIAQRMNDLTKVFGDATGMSGTQQDQQRFIDELSKIVCSPQAAPQSSTSPEFEQNVQSLIDVFAQETGHDFTPEQRDLLATGVRALVQINDNAENRHDIALIRNNIAIFIDNVQKVLDKQIDTNQRRLLNRALVRLVGDGSAPGDGGQPSIRPTR